jgi:hydroxymethylpyrimidine pyrophosphatase-like HAD family hydrolase
MGRFDGVLICSDVDGTFAYGKEVPEANLKAIEEFQAEGGRFTLVTGRVAGYHSTFPLRFNAPVVSENGTRISDEGSGRSLWTMPLDGCGQLLEWLDRQNGSLVHLYFEDGSLAVPFGEVADTVCGHRTGDLLKIVCGGFSSEESAVAFRDAARARFGSRYDVHRSWSTGVEFISPLGGKGNSLRFLRQICEDVHTVVAVGDYENDLSMFEAADRSFAPANACAEVLAAADETVCPCKEGAIAAVIARLGEDFK